MSRREDDTIRSVKYGGHPPTCSCSRCVAKRLGRPISTPKMGELEKKLKGLVECPTCHLLYLKELIGCPYCLGVAREDEVRD